MVKHAGYTERILLEGTTRDFASFSVRAITQFANQPAQPTQQLDEEVILIVKEGELTLTLNTKTKVLGPGSIVVVMPSDSYRLENKAPKPLTYYLTRYTSNEVPDLDLYRLAGGSFWMDWKEFASRAENKNDMHQELEYGTIMVKRLEIALTTLVPGMMGHPPHTQRSAELVCLIDNGAQVDINGIQHSANEGDVFFLESKQPPTIQNNGSKSCRYVTILFD